jgi:murein L,D-transpeptidase YafK
MSVSGPLSRPLFRVGGALIAAVLLALVPRSGPALRASFQLASGPVPWRVAKVAATRSFSPRSLGQEVRGCFLGLSSPIHIVVVDKAAQRLFLYRHYKHTTLVKSYPCATGENPGHKIVEGDHRTPEGVYFFIRVYRDNRMTIFGKQAWHLNYPNPVDRLRGRRGNGIYIHGLNKKLTPRSTKGCIAMRQTDLDNLSRHLRLYRTPVIVTSRLRGTPRFNDPASCRELRTIVKQQGHALVGQPLAAAVAVYTPRHLDRDLHPLVVSQVRNLAAKKINSRQFGLIRFLNQTHVWFLQELTLAHGRKAKIWRRLTYLDRARRPTLLANEWRPLDQRLMALAGRPPIMLAARTQPPIPALAPAELSRRQRAVVRLVQHWRQAWQQKDLPAYIACYDRSFRSQGMNRSQWKKYKGRLNRRYSFIRVRVSRLRVNLKGADRAVATFRLSYRSNYFHSRGVKTLVLVKRQGRWQIKRETFHRLGS